MVVVVSMFDYKVPVRVVVLMVVLGEVLSMLWFFY